MDGDSPAIQVRLQQQTLLNLLTFIVLPVLVDS